MRNRVLLRRHACLYLFIYVATVIPTDTPVVMSSSVVSSSSSGCPKCGAIKKSGKHSCCARGGAWFNNCGDIGDTKLDHTWAEGILTCKSRFCRGVDLCNVLWPCFWCWLSCWVSCMAFWTICGRSNSLVKHRCKCFYYTLTPALPHRTTYHDGPTCGKQQRMRQVCNHQVWQAQLLRSRRCLVQEMRRCRRPHMDRGHSGLQRICDFGFGETITPRHTLPRGNDCR